MNFPTEIVAIRKRIAAIDPVAYGRSRNFTDGAVTRLSPYISRGVISTRMVMEHVLSLGLPLEKVEKLIQELAWRDYWQQVWIARMEEIDTDLRSPQAGVQNMELPLALHEAETGIEAVDEAIRQWYQTGYMHNHVRMYVASLACNIGRSHWHTPARWLYYHLLDGDWASNALSWQWVAGTNSARKYYMNQENINKYCHSRQEGTFIDVPYEALPEMEVPEVLKETFIPEMSTLLPDTGMPVMVPGLPTLIYNYYNLDPMWRREEKANRILLLEPEVFEKHPVSRHCIRFAVDLAQNIPGLQVYTGSFSSLSGQPGAGRFIYKEHPLNKHYTGMQDGRDWMFPVKGDFPSFFKFWKECLKFLNSEIQIECTSTNPI